MDSFKILTFGLSEKKCHKHGSIKEVLLDYLDTSYGSVFKNMHQEQISKIQSLREQLFQYKIPTKEIINDTMKYATIIRHITKYYPYEKNKSHPKLIFAWSDFFGSKQTCIHPNFEWIQCIMRAAAQRIDHVLTTDVGYQVTNASFLWSMRIFQFVKNFVRNNIKIQKTSYDFDFIHLDFYIYYMKCCIQESLTIESSVYTSNYKNFSNASRLAMGTSDMYNKLYEMCYKEKYLPSTYEVMAKFKCTYYKLLAFYFRGLIYDESDRDGMRVSYFTVSNSLIKNLPKKNSLPKLIQDLYLDENSKINKKIRSTLRANDVVYKNTIKTGLYIDPYHVKIPDEILPFEKLSVVCKATKNPFEVLESKNMIRKK